MACAAPAGTEVAVDVDVHFAPYYRDLPTKDFAFFVSQSASLSLSVSKTANSMNTLEDHKDQLARLLANKSKLKKPEQLQALLKNIKSFKQKSKSLLPRFAPQKHKPLFSIVFTGSFPRTKESHENREFFSPFFHSSALSLVTLLPHRLHRHLHVTMFSLQTINTCQRVASFKLASTSKRSASSSLRAVVEPKENGSMDETVADAVQSAEKAFEMADATPAGEQAQAPRAMQAMMYVYSTFFHSLSFSCCRSR